MENKNLFKQQFRKRCFDFSISILRLSEKLRSKPINWSLVDQVVRSATSIGANVVEGGNSTSKREFINYFQISLKSTSETIYWLELLKELNQANLQEIEKCMRECIELKKMISTIILNTKDNSRL